MLARAVDALNAFFIKGKGERDLFKNEIVVNESTVGSITAKELIIQEKFNALSADYERTKDQLSTVRGIAKQLGVLLQDCLSNHQI